MNVGQAKEIARQWAVEEASRLPGFCGAYRAGSTNWLPDDAELPATSDVDVWVVLADAASSGKVGKFIYRDVMLDVAFAQSEELASPERILGDYHVAGSFRTPNVILDPTGRLTELQAAVSNAYAKRSWVRKRCEHARTHALRYVRSLREPAPLHDQVLAWLFANGVTTHVLLVAGLKNPTVRRRYVAARELLADYGRLGMYETLLESLGCARMSRRRVEHHLAALSDAFDAAKAVIVTPFVFASDISDSARPIAIDGSRELIARGGPSRGDLLDRRHVFEVPEGAGPRCANGRAREIQARLRGTAGRSWYHFVRRHPAALRAGRRAPSARLGSRGSDHGSSSGHRRLSERTGKMATIRALHHAALTVPTDRLEEARRFYSDVRGLKETARPEAELGRPGIWYGFGETELHIQCRDGAPPADSDYHPALIVDDLSGLRDRIEASGAKTGDAPVLMGRRRFFARDPFGNRLEFMSLP